MSENEAEFLKRIREIFRLEAQEHLQTISMGLIELEREPEPDRWAELIEELFRETHSLKGAARSVDQRDVEGLCQPMESAFAALKRGEIGFSLGMSDLFLQAVDHISQLVESDGEPILATKDQTREELIRQLESAAEGQEPEPPAQKAPEPLETAAKSTGETAKPADAASEQKSVAPELPPSPAPGSPSPSPPRQQGAQGQPAPALGASVRIPTDQLDPLLLQAEEMIAAKLAASQRVADLRVVQQGLDNWETESGRWSERQTAYAPKESYTRLSALQYQVKAVGDSLSQDQRTLRRMVDDHLETMKRVLMLPVGTMVDLLPKVVRDLSRDQGKLADLIIEGREIEIDKRILEGLKDPLIHLIRNCIDHGLLKPEEREAQNKPPQGTIRLSFTTLDSRQVEVAIEDDGEGIDLDKVKKAAVGKNLISAEKAAELDHREALQLIFLSGLSTSPLITDLSGRGLGMAIVRQHVEKLGGELFVDSKKQEGTSFRLRLPMTLATFRGILVRVGEQQFLLPTVNTLRVFRVSPEEVKTVENQKTIRMEGEVLSLVNLGACLGIPERGGISSPQIDGSGQEEQADYMPVLVLASSGRRIAFGVDQVLDEQQVLLKSLGRQLVRVRNIAGAAVLGSGRVTLVLNPSDLMASALRVKQGPEAPAEKEAPETRRILVADDSITARTLIKNILQTVGYQVTTAVDGMDALTHARSEEFDLVVSDVDMPRMNGFEFTAKLRADPKLAELPVVLVTALGSREDRERGIETGANAYIVKSSFDQSNLLDVIRKLL